ncbi:MAG: FAD-dependent monooxygenase [Streptosporangiaceae bacterium]
MRVACIGGGPGGLFFAALLRAADPRVEVTVYERNRPDDVFGFGVVFSDAALGAIDQADPALLHALRDHGAHWNRIEVRVHGKRLRCGGNGMGAIARRTLLALLRERAAAAGVRLRFEHEVRDPGELDGFDLVVAADGANSMTRGRFAGHFLPTVDVGVTKFIWLATTYMFDGLTFVHERGPDGVFAVHGYPYSADESTFIVETDEGSWRRAGLDAFDTTQPPGPSDERSRAYLEGLFAGQVDGHPLLTNNSRWANFRTVRTRTWRHGNLVLLGDAAHTAHFSVGSGTKMAMEDAATLVRSLAEHPGDVEGALGAYEHARRPDVERIQGSARPSLSWWEHFGRYHDSFGPEQFAFHFLTRSITRGKVERRDPGFVAAMEAWWRQRHGAAPLDSPLRIEGLRLDRRVVPVRVGREGTWIESAGGGRLPALPLSRVRQSPPAPPFGLWLEAPDGEDDLPKAVAELETGAAAGAVFAAVHGGTPVTRVLLSEEARLSHELPAVLVDDGLDADGAETLLLSGRADAVGGTSDRTRKGTTP